MNHIMYASTSIQTPLSAREHDSPLDSVLGGIMTELRALFPDDVFSYEFRGDKGCDVYVNNIDLYLSDEFNQFLDRAVTRLDNTQYMLLDFVPGYLTVSSMQSFRDNVVVLESKAVTCLENPAKLIEGRYSTDSWVLPQVNYHSQPFQRVA